MCMFYRNGLKPVKCRPAGNIYTNSHIHKLLPSGRSLLPSHHHLARGLFGIVYMRTNSRALASVLGAGLRAFLPYPFCYALVRLAAH